MRRYLGWLVTVAAGALVGAWVSPMTRSDAKPDEPAPPNKKAPALDIRTASELHLRFQETCRWPELRVSYNGVLAAVMPRKARGESKLDVSTYRWDVCLHDDRTDLNLVLFQFEVRTEGGDKAIAKTVVNGQQLFVFFAEDTMRSDGEFLGPDDSLSLRLRSPKDAAGVGKLTPRQVIKELFGAKL